MRLPEVPPKIKAIFTTLHAPLQYREKEVFCRKNLGLFLPEICGELSKSTKGKGCNTWRGLMKFL